MFICKLVTDYGPVFAWLGSIAQLVAFLALALDLWPEWHRWKSNYLLDILRQYLAPYKNQRDETGDITPMYMFAPSEREGDALFWYGRQRKTRFWKSTADFAKVEFFDRLYADFEANEPVMRKKINSKPSWRISNLGFAVFIGVAGSLAIIFGTIPCPHK